MSKKDDDYFERERERQINEDAKGEREIAKRASEKAKRTSAYDAQRKNPPGWPKPPSKS